MFKKISNIDIINAVDYNEFSSINENFSKAASVNHKANVNLLDSSLFKKVSKLYNISDNPSDYIYAIARGVTTLVEGARAQSTTNANGDSFPREELLRKRSSDGFYVYQTFNLKPFHTEHKADNPLLASGFLLDSHYNQNDLNDEHVDIVVCCDKSKDPEGAKGILTGRVRSYSMGCNVDYTICSVCGKKATKKADYCNHIRFMKCSYLNGTYVFEKCYGVEYTELSKVKNPADKTAITQEVLSKAASRKEDSFLEELGFDKMAKKEILGYVRQNMDSMPNSVLELFEKIYRSKP